MDTSNKAPDTYGIRVRKLREARGWGVRELARRAELSAGLISGLEAGKATKLQPKTKSALARAFGWRDWAVLMASTALEPAAGEEAAEAETEIAAPEVRGWLRGVHASAAALIPLYPDAAKLVLQLADDPESPFGHSPPPWSRTIVNVNTSAAAALSLAA